MDIVSPDFPGGQNANFQDLTPQSSLSILFHPVIFFSITMIAVLQILRRFGQELEGRVVDTV